MGPKTQAWLLTLQVCFLTYFVLFYSAVTEKKSKMSQQMKGQGRHCRILMS